MSASALDSGKMPRDGAPPPASIQSLTRRRLTLLGPLALAACMDDVASQQEFAPFAFDYLAPLRLNVAEIGIQVATTPVAGDLGVSAPVPPVAALRQMASDRIKPGGTSGRAVFTIGDASIVRESNGVVGSMAVELAIVLPDGSRPAYAQARVERRRSGLRGNLSGVLYELVRDMMNDMNVEFEYQVRRALHEWLQFAATAPSPDAVQQQDLAAPSPTLRPRP